MCMQANGCQHKTALSPFLIRTSSWIGYVSTRSFTFELSWCIHRCQHQTKTELARFQNIRQSISMKATDYHGPIMLSSLFWPKQLAMGSYKKYFSDLVIHICPDWLSVFPLYHGTIMLEQNLRNSRGLFSCLKNVRSPFTHPQHWEDWLCTELRTRVLKPKKGFCVTLSQFCVYL